MTAPVRDAIASGEGRWVCPVHGRAIVEDWILLLGGVDIKLEMDSDDTAFAEWRRADGRRPRGTRRPGGTIGRQGPPDPLGEGYGVTVRSVVVRCRPGGCLALVVAPPGARIGIGVER